MANKQPPHNALTVDDLRRAIEVLVQDNPEAAGWPIHVLNMEDEKDGHEPDDPWDNLVTHVETDSFQDDQGTVLSLLAWRSMPARKD